MRNLKKINFTQRYADSLVVIVRSLKQNENPQTTISEDELQHLRKIKGSVQSISQREHGELFQQVSSSFGDGKI